MELKDGNIQICLINRRFMKKQAMVFQTINWVWDWEILTRLILNDAIKAEYGENRVNMLKGLSTFYVDGKMIVTESKVFVEAKNAWW